MEQASKRFAFDTEKSQKILPPELYFARSPWIHFACMKFHSYSSSSFPRTLRLDCEQSGNITDLCMWHVTCSEYYAREKLEKFLFPHRSAGEKDDIFPLMNMMKERLMRRRRWVEMCLKHANYFSRSLALPEQNFVSCSYLLSCAISPTWKEKLNDTWSEKNCSLKPYTLKQMIQKVSPWLHFSARVL